jgi:hypothetical protein
LETLLIFFVTVAIIIASILIGYRIGLYNVKRNETNKKSSLGSIISAMFALLSFILAFTFSLTSSRYAARKQLVLDEANAIGTALLRTDILLEPSRTESRKLYQKYVNIRVEVTENPKKLSQALIDSDLIHEELWSHLTDNFNQKVDSELLGFYMESLNEVIDIHSKRVTVGIQNKIPRAVWFILYFITIQAMLALGYEFALKGSISIVGMYLLALMFSAIISIIADLDRSQYNLLLKVDQQPLIDLQQKLNSSIE